MDVAQITSALANSNVTNGIQTSLLRSVEGLQGDLAARLFSSLGLGQNINTYA